MPNTLRDALNLANPNHVPDGMQALPAGEAFGLLPRSEVLSASSGIAIPSVPAMLVVSAFDRTNGVYLVQELPEIVSGAGEVSVLADGTISVDPACDEVEVVYFAAEGTVVTETLQATASAATFLGGKTASKVLAATVLTGVTLGPLAVVKRAGAAGAGEISLLADGSGVDLNAADVVSGTISVTYVARPTRSVSAALGATVKF